MQDFPNPPLKHNKGLHSQSRSHVIFRGLTGKRIEGLHTQALSKNPPIALIFHPHPLHDGNMDNKIVHTLYKALTACGYTVLRINFKGVGRSEGVFNGTAEELNEATAALDWLKIQNPDSTSTLIAGVSFGAWIAMQLIMRRPEIKNFIVITPPVGKHDFSFFSPCPAPGLIVQGDKDSIVEEEKVADLTNKLTKQKNVRVTYQVIQGADHFFRNKLDELEAVITRYLTGELIQDEPKTPTTTKLYL